MNNSTTNTHNLQNFLSSERDQIIKHSLYSNIQSLEDLHIFMEHHVYAVWDFMSLLKSLQRNLTSIEHPWIPVANNETCFLINEIVVGEESDVDQNGVRMSHFELYLKSMEESGANIQGISEFIQALKDNYSVEEAFDIAETPIGAREFVRFTLKEIESNQMHRISAVFTFGREDLIPDMFMTMVNQLYSEYPEKVATYKYYLERHIEVDGGHHSHLALSMTEKLCHTDEMWNEAMEASKCCLIARRKLWDSVLSNIQASKQLN